MTNKEKIIEAFNKVKSLGWIKSHRRNNTGIGKTFEDCVGVVENNLKEPDLYGFEIKAHRSESASYVTLFTKSPSFPKKGANAYLKDKFGEHYEGSNLKKLHTSIFGNRFNLYAGKYSFRLINSRVERRIYIGVYSEDGNKPEDMSVYYAYEDIEKALRKKLHDLFYVSAQRRMDADGKEEFYFDSAEIYSFPTLDNFLNMLDKGDIMFDIRIGTYQSGVKIGKPHDHGNCFRVKEDNLSKLYSTKEVVV